MKFQHEYTCRHPDGLTLLAAIHIVKIVLRSQSGVRIEANGHCANALDINGLMSLRIENGDGVTVTVDGRDAYEVMENIEDVLIHTAAGVQIMQDSRAVLENLVWSSSASDPRV